MPQQTISDISPRKPLKKTFLEITNACNLSCEFCHGTNREIKYLTPDEFTCALQKLNRVSEFIYLHLMGEPLLHPRLRDFLQIADALGAKIIITTNGTLLGKCSEFLLNAPALRKVSISLHSYEVNTVNMSIDDYLAQCFEFCKSAAARGKVAVMRLWNLGGKDSMNEYILAKMHEFFRDEWKEIFSGYKLGEWLFLEWGERFEWPDVNADYKCDDHSCYGLRNQIGVLSNGTVVPCCLDADGAIPLGNIFSDEPEDILNSSRAVALKESFRNRSVTEELCRRCGYAQLKNR